MDIQIRRLHLSSKIAFSVGSAFPQLLLAGFVQPLLQTFPFLLAPCCGHTEPLAEPGCIPGVRPSHQGRQEQGRAQGYPRIPPCPSDSSSAWWHLGGVRYNGKTGPGEPRWIQPGAPALREGDQGSRSLPGKAIRAPCPFQGRQSGLQIPSREGNQCFRSLPENWMFPVFPSSFPQLPSSTKSVNEFWAGSKCHPGCQQSSG